MVRAGSGVVIIGAGPAGLATSRELQRHGVEHVVLERGDVLGYTWATLYDSLVLHTGKRLSALPGMPFPRTTPLFPSRQQFLDYLGQYAAAFHLPIETRRDVTRVTRSGAGWIIAAGDEAFHAHSVVIATGIASAPRTPEFPGREQFGGDVMHSRDYRRPGPFVHRRVLVVGVGNSAGEIAAELAGAGARVTVAVRSGARVVPRQVLGVPIQYLALATSRLPAGVQRTLGAVTGRLSSLARGPSPLPPPAAAACSVVPLIGFHLSDAIRAGSIQLKPGIDRFTPEGVRFVDGSNAAFDVVMLATGYRPALGCLGDLVSVDGCGFARRRDRVRSAEQPDLYFVGHSYDIRGGLYNIGLDAKAAAAVIARREGSPKP